MKQDLTPERERHRCKPRKTKCSDAVQYTASSWGEFFCLSKTERAKLNLSNSPDKLARKLTILRLVSEEGKGGGREVEKAAICYLRISTKTQKINSQIVYKGFRVSKGHVVIVCVAGPKPIDKLLSC